MASLPPILGAPYCGRCGYNLTGLDKPRCPECGEPFDPALAGLVTRRPVPDREIVLWLTLPPVAISLAGLAAGGCLNMLNLTGPAADLAGVACLLMIVGGPILAALGLARRIEWGQRVLEPGADFHRRRWGLLIGVTLATLAFYLVEAALVGVLIAAIVSFLE